MRQLSRRSVASSRPRTQPPPTLHLELWVARRKDRARLSAILRRTYRIARPITLEGGGSGPWVFLVDPDPPRPKTTRLRTTLGLRPDEDLWLELAFYPDRATMRRIIRRIWKQPRFLESSQGIDRLVSRRKPGYDATLAHARLIPI